MLASGMLVFMQSVGDYSIPSLFGVNVYSLELFARYSAGHSISRVIFDSLPLSALTVIFTAAFAIIVSRNKFELGRFNNAAANPFKDEWFMRIPAAIGVVICAFFVFVPVFCLLTEALKEKNIMSVISSSASQFAVSIGTCATAAALSVIAALGFGIILFESRKRNVFSGIVLCLSALFFVLPSPVIGLSLIAVFNSKMLAFIYGSPMMPVIAQALRFCFISVAIIFMAFSRIGNGISDALSLYSPGFFTTAAATLGLVRKPAICAFLAVFALSMGEFALSLLVALPGMQPLSVKIYNYLHYGASGTIAVLCLAVLAAVTASAAGVYGLTRRCGSQ
jgi:iron(III) transport system permease protein